MGCSVLLPCYRKHPVIEGAFCDIIYDVGRGGVCHTEEIMQSITETFTKYVQCIAAWRGRCLEPRTAS
jgi:hypothetical protein